MDRKREPSVDCAATAATMTPPDDAWTRGDTFDAVCEVLRQHVQDMKLKMDDVDYKFDVAPDPIEGNPAHHLVVSVPAVPEKPDKIWKRARSLLAAISRLLPQYE